MFSSDPGASNIIGENITIGIDIKAARTERMVSPIRRPFLLGIARIHFCCRTSVHNIFAQATGVMIPDVFHHTKSMCLLMCRFQAYLDSQRGGQKA